MEQKSPREIQEELAQPFAPVDLEWRLQQTFAYQDTMRGIAVPYVTNRAIQNRLDEVVGADHWYNDYRPWHGTQKKEAQICGISIFFESRGEWITKWDGAEDSDIEPIKGGLSDSMKRAAVQWGIGRVLYNMDAVFVDVEKKGKSYVIKKGEQAKLDKAYTDMLNRLGLKPAPAGGLQPEFTSQSTEDAPKQKQETPPTQAPQGSKTVMAGGADNTSAFSGPKMVTDGNKGHTVPYEYKVLSSKVQKGMNNTNTLAELVSVNGKTIQVFAKGEHPLLAPGALLTGTRIITKRQDTVVFYVLEAYQIVQSQQAAA